MPTYDYRCAACGRRFERFEPISSGGSKACPKCGKKKARRMIGAGAGVIFKGSGFYATDSRRSDGGAAPSAASSEKKETAGESKGKEKDKKEPKK